MANKKHLKILQRGVKAWNEWKESYPGTIPNLRKANLSGLNLKNIDFMKADLEGAILDESDLAFADLSGANLADSSLNKSSLHKADLSNANLTKARLRHVDLTEANLERCILVGADLREAIVLRTDLSDADLREANLSQATLLGANLIDANLSASNLTGAMLLGADLGYANLNGATLVNTDLTQVRALSTDFTGVTFTGACIQDWNINGSTILEEIECSYIYLATEQEERYPSSGNFEAGEFEKLFRKAFSFIDLIFRDGIDWQAFAYTFEKIKSQNPNANLAVQSIENKGDGVLVVRINTSQEAEKPEIYSGFMQIYELVHNLLEERYRNQLISKDVQIAQYSKEVNHQREYINNLFSLLNQQTEMQKLMSENSSRIINIGSGNYVESNSGTYVQGDYLNMAQDLSQAAKEIQELLQQLQKHGMTEQEAQQQVATDIAEQAQNNSSMMGKLTKWGQSLGDAAAKATVSDVVKGVVKLALTASGIPLP